VIWAEAAFSKGIENENIKMLTSLGLESPIDTTEAKSYFDKVVVTIVEQFLKYNA
jgi:hypothetical protein